MVTNKVYYSRQFPYCVFCKGTNVRLHSYALLKLKGLNCFWELKHKRMMCKDCGRISTDPKIQYTHYGGGTYRASLVATAMSILDEGFSLRAAGWEIEKRTGHRIPSSTLHDWAVKLGVDTSWSRHRKGK